VHQSSIFLIRNKYMEVCYLFHKDTGTLLSCFLAALAGVLQSSCKVANFVFQLLQGVSCPATLLTLGKSLGGRAELPRGFLYVKAIPVSILFINIKAACEFN